jgi:hypothetical protein
MHIHGGHMNPNASLTGAHSSASALAARRAEETRKKLFATASELDAGSSSESAWMVTAWAGGNSAANQGSSQDSSPNRPSISGISDQTKTVAEADDLPHTALARPVSYWA